MSETSAPERPATILVLRTTPPVPPAELVERAEIDTQLHTARNVSQVPVLLSGGVRQTRAMVRYFDQQRLNRVATVWILLDDTDNDVGADFNLRRDA